MPRRRAQNLPEIIQILRQQAGFSLIETILVLLLLGIMAAVAAFGISKVVTGFMTSRGSVAIAGKGQLALLRLSREFRVITSVTSASATSITFVALHPPAVASDPPVAKSYTVAKSGNTITLNDGANNDILVDQVNSLTLAYYDTYNGTSQTTWASSRRIIQMTIILNGPESSTLSFTTRIAPRNI